LRPGQSSLRRRCASRSGEARPEEEEGGQNEGVSSEEEVVRLVSTLEAWREAYYNAGESPVADAVYDATVTRLSALDGGAWRDSALAGPSPWTSSGLGKVRHVPRMSSLRAVTEEGDLEKFGEALRKRIDALADDSPATASQLRWVVEPKVDGLAVSVSYDADGHLVKAATRGDGEVGEDVTHTIRNFVPGRLCSPWPGGGPCQVRGEVYMEKAAFEAWNENQGFANPRNAAAGSLRLLSADDASKRPLSFAAYSWIPSGGADLGPRTQWGRLELLKALGMPTLSDNRVCDSFSEAVAFAREWMRPESRSKLAFEADGAVLKLDDVDLQEALGTIGASADPRWAVAWKFPAEEGVTQLKDVKLSVGRTGQVVPNAVLSPISLGGAVLRRASLHNFDVVDALELRIGDSVVVRRAGDVIPYVVRCLPELRPSDVSDVHKPPYDFRTSFSEDEESDGDSLDESLRGSPIVRPTACPGCGAPLNASEEDEEGVALYCDNSSCHVQAERRLAYFAATLKVEGLGKANAHKLLREGLVADPADLFTGKVTPESLGGIEGFAAKSAMHLCEELRRVRVESTPARLLQALGIRHVGEGTAGLLEREFGGVKAILGAGREALEAVDGIGPVTAGAVASWAAVDANRSLVDRLEAAGVAAVSAAAPATSAPAPDSGHGTLVGVSVVFTGSLPGGLTRAAAKALAEARGASVKSAVTKSTGIVVVGAGSGAKRSQAEALGVRCLAWDEFHAEFLAEGDMAA